MIEVWQRYSWEFDSLGVVHSSAFMCNHVAVVQLVEHQIVALVVENSSFSGHPMQTWFNEAHSARVMFGKTLSGHDRARGSIPLVCQPATRLSGVTLK